MKRKNELNYRKPSKLTEEDINTAQEWIPRYLEGELTLFMKYLFIKMARENKLSHLLSFLNYSPFTDTLDNKRFGFFIELVNCIPDKYKFLVPTYNDNEILKKLIHISIESINSNDYPNQQIIEVFKTLINTKPEILVDRVKELLQERHTEFPEQINILTKDLVKSVPELHSAYQDKENCNNQNLKNSNINNNFNNIESQTSGKAWQARETKRLRGSEPSVPSISK